MANAKPLPKPSTIIHGQPAVPPRKPRVSRVPQDENKEQKFVRLATRRVNKVRKALDQLGLLGSPSYTSTEEQRNKITAAIKESVEFNLSRLNKEKSTAKADFRL